jgi:crossover junction endodeoxyribonuclease RusA
MTICLFEGNTPMIDIFIPGIPAPQGSKRYVGRGIMIESCKAVKPWRESVRTRLITEDSRPIERIEGAVVSTLEFILPRPKSTPKKRTPLAIPKDNRP